MGQDLDTLAAKHNSRKPTSSVRGHNDQIAMFVGRGLNDRLIGMIMLYIDNVAGHAFFQCHALHLIEAFVRKAFQLRLISPLFGGFLKFIRFQAEKQDDTTVML